MKYVFCILIGYLIGAINPSYIIAKLRGFDIREKGSKNAGASNALILFGKVLGIGCALFDIAKATLPYGFAESCFPSLHIRLRLPVWLVSLDTFSRSIWISRAAKDLPALAV